MRLKGHRERKRAASALDAAGLQALAEQDRSRPGSAVRRQGSVYLRDHQRTQRVDLRLLRHILRSLLLEILDRSEFELDIHIVEQEEMTRLNETFLRHKGSTDVITFDYGVPESRRIQGEIFVCLTEAFQQAKKFRVTWQEELVRYAVHGVLHLCGYDDKTVASRREMKRIENGALKRLAREYYFPKLGGHRKSANGR
ncbi:MAG TPA: rRNA maturation RNase YbeY [Terriglobales bacterium]|nr:rRNA maturation RNase YbeY [Terriglobales bacterium]